MSWLSAAHLNQLGLACGIVAAILLALATKIGVVSKDGTTYFTGLDPMESAEKNFARVRASHWRNRYFTPAGWSLLAISFLTQFIATFLPAS